MGLLDQFSNLNEDQTQGLLAAAAQMLQQSGPSRTPVSLGQIVGGGLGAYQDSTLAAKKRKLEEDQAKQVGQLRGLQIQEAQGGLQAHEAARLQAAKIAGLQQEFAAQGAPGSGGMRAMPTGPASMDGGAAAQPQQPPQMGQPRPQSQYDQAMAYAQFLQSKGMIHEAMAAAKEAQVLKPKFANEPRTVRGPDGKPMLVQMADDGTVRPIEGGYGVAEKLNFQNLGGKTVALDPYSGAASVSFNHTQTPDSIASTNSAAAGRAQAERHFQAGQSAPQYMETTEGVVALPKRLAPGAAPVGQVVMGPSGAPLEKKQSTPQYVVQAITGNAKSLSSIDAALGSLSTPAGKDAVGMKGYLPNSMLNRMFPSGTETRANISDVGSLILHDRSGAAVTAAESPRLMPFIPLATDDAATAKKKLTRFKQIFEAETNNLTFAFPQAKKLAEYAASNAPAKAPPAPAGAANAKGWTLHTDANGNKAYVSPDGSQFEEVK